MQQDPDYAWPWALLDGSGLEKPQDPSPILGGGGSWLPCSPSPLWHISPHPAHTGSPPRAEGGSRSRLTSLQPCHVRAPGARGFRVRWPRLPAAGWMLSRGNTWLQSGLAPTLLSPPAHARADGIGTRQGTWAWQEAPGPSDPAPQKSPAPEQWGRGEGLGGRNVTVGLGSERVQPHLAYPRVLPAAPPRAPSSARLPPGVVAALWPGCEARRQPCTHLPGATGHPPAACPGLIPRALWLCRSQPELGASLGCTQGHEPGTGRARLIPETSPQALTPWGSRQGWPQPPPHSSHL